MARPASTFLRALAAAAVLASAARASPLAAERRAAVTPLPAKRGEGSGEGPWRAEEDFVRAFAAAKAQGALVLVDVWAPW